MTDYTWIAPTIVAVTGLIYTIKTGRKTRKHVDSTTAIQTNDLTKRIQELEAQLAKGQKDKGAME